MSKHLFKLLLAHERGHRRDTQKLLLIRIKTRSLRCFRDRRLIAVLPVRPSFHNLEPVIMRAGQSLLQSVFLQVSRP